MGMILRPIRILIWICGWRLDRPVDPIKIECMSSPTLRPRTCGRPVVSQSLGAPNQYRASNLRSSWSCSNTRLSSPKIRPPISGVYTTLGELWTASPNGHEHVITEWWYMCASSFFAIKKLSTNSESQTNGIVKLVKLWNLVVLMICL
jgi:hypothetical protein